MQTLRKCDIINMIDKACAARANAYAPYSNFAVGAALLTTSGNIYVGCNVENASYGGTICAERVAVGNAVVADDRAFEAIAIVTGTETPAAPCGICRQVLYEFNPEMLVIMTTLENDEWEEHTLSSLLPHGFGPKSLSES